VRELARRYYGVPQGPGGGPCDPGGNGGVPPDPAAERGVVPLPGPTAMPLPVPTGYGTCRNRLRWGRFRGVGPAAGGVPWGRGPDLRGQGRSGAVVAPAVPGGDECRQSGAEEPYAEGAEEERAHRRAPFWADLDRDLRAFQRGMTTTVVSGMGSLLGITGAVGGVGELGGRP